MAVIPKVKRKYNQQPNMLSRSITNMGMIERRIMYQAINQMNTSAKDGRWNINPDLFQNMDFIIPFSALKSSNHAEIKAAFLKLMTRIIIPHETDKEMVAFVPFPYVKLLNGVAYMTMLSNVVPAFMELSGGCTKYDLEEAMALSGVYAQKLFELFSLHAHEKKWEVELADLQKMLNATNYRYVDFKKNCLDKGIEEINKHTKLAVKFDPKKTGKAVTSIEFYITTASPAKKVLNSIVDELKITPDEKLVALAKPFMSYYLFSKSQRAEILGSTTKMQKLIKIETQIKAGLLAKPTNPTGYMTVALGLVPEKF